MKVIGFFLLDERSLIARLKETELKGFNRFQIYQNSQLELVEQVDPGILVPPQRYVLNSGIQNITALYHEFLSKGFDIFQLRGAVFFWLEGSDPDVDPPIPFLPPIVEESTARDGSLVEYLINDGMHRVSAAKRLDRKINIIHVRNVPKEYPYYAYPFVGGWDNIITFDELPDNFEKKDYRNPEGYKQLFRMFNDVFPGVQADRKNSNPSHLRE